VQPWDIAAGVLLVREAGGRVTDFRGAGTGPLEAPARGREISCKEARGSKPVLHGRTKKAAHRAAFFVGGP
jgi:myo-inositol-1(or 4)-monophosphatase